jgi:hypothetical protein
LGDESEFLGSGAAEAGLRQDLAPIVGRQVVGVVVAGPFHDMTLEFAGGWMLHTLADAPQWESWQIATTPGELVIAGPSSLWSHFPPTD